jgi:hypothetical protein
VPAPPVGVAGCRVDSTLTLGSQSLHARERVLPSTWIAVGRPGRLFLLPHWGAVPTLASAACYVAGAPQCARDGGDDGVEIGEDEMLFDTEDTPTDSGEKAITASIQALSTVVRCAIDFDGKPDLGAGRREAHDTSALLRMQA